jgi:cobalt/nickel transport protein
MRPGRHDAPGRELLEESRGRMKRSGALLLTVLGMLLTGGIALGHFHTFWPDGPNGYAKLGEEIVYQYFWGHPYEMILFDAKAPTAYVVAPDGEREPVSLEPVEMEDPETGLPRAAFRLRYTPENIGDSWLVLEAPPYPIEEEGEAVQDYVKQCIHVMAEQGWDSELGLPVELVPLTRPYGLEPGFAFTARAYMGGEPMAGATVEIEKFNGFHVGEEMLPTDQFGMEDVPMITRVAKTDAFGYVTYTLDEPGWWMISVSAESGTAAVEGEEYPRVLRGGLWVHVDEEFSVGR